MTKEYAVNVAIGMHSYIKELESKLEQVNTKLADINDCLYGRGLSVSGWHLNGDLEPMDNFFEENDWEIME